MKVLRPALCASVLLLVMLALLGGCGGGGAPAMAAAPTGLSATPGNQQVALTWNGVAGATSYFVYQGSASGLTTASTRTGPFSTTATTVTGLVNGVLRYVAVSSVVGGVESPLGGETSATPLAPDFKLLDATPTPFAKDVPVNGTLAFTFSAPIQSTTALAPGAVKLESGSIHNPTLVPFTLAFQGSTMVLTPNAPLAPSTKLRVTLAPTVADTDGDTLGGPVNDEVTTGPAADTTPPTVLSVAPASAATNVPTSTTFEVLFSEDVRVEDVTIANVTLTDGATPVAVTVSQPASNKLLARPNAPLAAGAMFTLTVGTGVRDRAGNALAAPFVSTASTAAAAAPANTTSFMLYVTASNDSLEGELVKDLNKWEAAGGSDAHPNVRMYGQMDTVKADLAPQVHPTPFHVRLRRDGNRTAMNSTAVRVLAAGDLTTPTAISDFILACNADFVAQRNVFVFSNHGMNYTGTNADSASRRIELAEIVQGFTTARNAGVNLDVVVFDVCVMGGWENLALVAPFCNYIVAGETTTTGMEWEAGFTQSFLPNPATDSLSFFKDLVDKTVASPNRPEPNGFFIYDCTKIPTLKTAMVTFYNELHAALLANTVTVPGFTDAFNASLPLEIFSGGEKEMCDVVRLCEALSALPGAPAALTTAAQGAITAVRDAVVHRRTSAAWEKLSGVSAALGKVDNPVLGPVLVAIDATMQNPAALLATTRAAHLANPVNQPTVANARSLNTVNPTPAAQLELDVTTTNGQSGLIYSVVSRETAPASNIFEFLGVNAWTDDVSATVEWRWDGRVLQVSDGSATDFVPGVPLDFESTLLSVDAVLTDTESGTVQSCIIVFDASVPRVEGVFVDPPGVGKALGRSQVTAGDTLRIVKQRWNEGADNVESFNSPVLLTVGATGLASLTASSVAAPSGTYEFSVIVEDPEGNDDETSVTVSIP